MDFVEYVIARELAGDHRQNPPKPFSAQASPKPDAARDEKLWRACCRFEGLLIQQMLQAMQKTLPRGGFLSTGFAGEIGQMMLAQAIADASSARTPLNFAHTLYRQMTQVQQATSDLLIKGAGDAGGRA